MRVTVTGASGLVGGALTTALKARGAEVTVLSRDPSRAQRNLGVQALGWDPASEPAPARALQDRDAVIHLAGESIAQRWTHDAKHRIRESRVAGTRHLVDGLRALHADRSATPPSVLVSGSAIGYYGPHGDEPLDEDAPAGQGFLAQTCVGWEAQAQSASELGMRVVQVRTGVVLHREGGALAKMLTPFRLGVGGPVAGGQQYISWIHRDDLVGLLLAAVEHSSWSGPINATAPEPVRNKELSHALGRALKRPSLLPVPGVALRALYGEMAELITTGARALPAKALVFDHRFQHPHLDEALSSALAQETSGP